MVEHHICAMCETVSAKWNEPASAADPSLATTQASALERRLAELERGTISPAALHERMLEMCAMCQEIVCDADEISREALGRRIRYRVRQLGRAVAA